jgi:hypothetical protein
MSLGFAIQNVINFGSAELIGNPEATSVSIGSLG